jgi:hypothetical protein
MALWAADWRLEEAARRLKRVGKEVMAVEGEERATVLDSMRLSLRERARTGSSGKQERFPPLAEAAFEVCLRAGDWPRGRTRGRMGWDVGVEERCR